MLRFVLVALVTLCSVVAAHAGPSGTENRPLKVAASGKPLRLGDVYDVDPDCSAVAGITIRLLIAPAHGQFTSRPGMVFPQFPASNPDSVCNGRRVLGSQQTYISRPGYTGPDSIDFEIIFPNGEARHIHVPIRVM